MRAECFVTRVVLSCVCSFNVYRTLRISLALHQRPQINRLAQRFVVMNGFQGREVAFEVWV